MRRVLLALAVVASSFVVSGVNAPEVEAIGCTWCEIAGTMEGSGIIRPPIDRVRSIEWEGVFEGVKRERPFCESACANPGVDRVTWEFELDGSVRYEPFVDTVCSQACPRPGTYQGTGHIRFYGPGDPDHESPIGTASVVVIGADAQTWAIYNARTILPMTRVEQRIGTYARVWRPGVPDSALIGEHFRGAFEASITDA